MLFISCIKKPIKKISRACQVFYLPKGQNIEPVYETVDNRYDQSHIPVRQQHTAEGHNVRALYLFSAMADLGKEYNDQKLITACKNIFENIINKRMYITGGVDSSHYGEAFTYDYDLPNLTAHSETCA
ncbi:MAG TPA: hypothetical protein GX745_06835, partial [Clostridiales bacterium]|nr:hypothetical protein [Clostridiales bacterium]